MERAGVLNYRHELIAGMIVCKSPMTIRCARIVRVVLFWLTAVFGEEFVMIHAGVHVAHADDMSNAPEPDVILFNKPDDEIFTDEPYPEDIRLLVEVTDFVGGFDLGTRAALYARAGVPEYWVVSVEERIVYVHTNPTDAGTYTRREVRENGTLAPIDAPPSAAIPVSGLLPLTETS